MTTAILRATNQLGQSSKDRTHPNFVLHTMQTIMIDDPNVDRTDPTYVVDVTQSHCSKYELKLINMS